MNIRVAIADKFLNAYEKLQPATKNKVRQFIDKFKANPTQNGINYEKISQAADPAMRSVRIDQSYRAIVLKPTEGNVYVLLWVDHHDEAYAWASTRRASIHPETGSLQILTTEEKVQQKVAEVSEQSSASTATPAEGLFTVYRPRELLQLGIPEILLPLVYHLKTEAELFQAVEFLPEEALEALVSLHQGGNLEDAYKAQQAVQAQAQINEADVDTHDFETALQHPDSRRRFVLIDDDQALEQLLDAPLAKWRVFLHPSQQRIVDLDIKGDIRVLGGAGTGKTVVAMHRARHLAASLSGAERVLFTTFTKNLAQDIYTQLRALCTPEELTRIEVTPLDAWVSQQLKRINYGYKIMFFKGQNASQRKLWQDIWNIALEKRPLEEDATLTEAFYEDEWQKVIAPRGVTDMRGYFKVNRKGRGTPLNRTLRKKIWPVFQEYRLELKSHGYIDPLDAYREMREVLENQELFLPYRHVVLDEAQDMSEQALRLLSALTPSDAPNRLFLVGDAHQRIYGNQLVLKHCGINIQGRHHSHRLKMNYRTTDEIRKWSTQVLHNCTIDDLDEGEDNLKGYFSLMFGENPVIKAFKNRDQEVAFITQSINTLLQDHIDLRNICVVARPNPLVSQYAESLESQGFRTHIINANNADDRDHPGLRLATMHRVKGLEFEFVFIAGANRGVLPLTAALINTGDDTEQAAAELRERSLLYVAATRAKKQLFVTASGEPSPLISL